MDIQVIYNTPYYIPLGIFIATYFYLTGISAGSFVISAVTVLGGKKEYKSIGKIGSILAPVSLLIAPIFLLIDLEQPMRFWHLYIYLQMTSPITYGTFLLSAYPLNGVLYAWALFANKEKTAKILGITGIPLAICTHGYTGFILALGKGRPLWSTALMPTLFIVSAMVSGIALVILIASFNNFFFTKRKDVEKAEQEKKLILNLGKFMGATIVADLFLILNDILVLLTSKTEEYHVAQLLLFGEFKFLFLGIEIFLGSIVPLFVVFFPKTGQTLRGNVFASLLVMIGVFAMRLTVVYAGQSVPLH
ncbi:MAG: NrfD/PsrC family molybdoenzyme membrane anchor subunit [Acidobacteriota bacterium]